MSLLEQYRDCQTVALKQARDGFAGDIEIDHRTSTSRSGGRCDMWCSPAAPSPAGLRSPVVVAISP
jgi:hypothetical protein